MVYLFEFSDNSIFKNCKQIKRTNKATYTKIIHVMSVFVGGSSLCAHFHKVSFFPTANVQNPKTTSFRAKLKWESPVTFDQF